MSKCSHAPLQTGSSTAAAFLYLWTTVDSVPRLCQLSLCYGENNLWLVQRNANKPVSLKRLIPCKENATTNTYISVWNLIKNLTFSVWWLLAQSSAVVTHCEGHFENGNRQGKPVSQSTVVVSGACWLVSYCFLLSTLSLLRAAESGSYSCGKQWPNRSSLTGSNSWHFSESKTC